jgi:CBS domain containing-hemolysin-like protein
MFTRKNKIVDPTSVEYNIMNFKDALVSDKMIPVEKAEKLILEGSNEEILQKIILTKHLTLPVVNSKNEIQGCIRTDVYLKHYLNDGDTDPRPYLKKIKLISKNAVMSDVIALANKDQPIVGVINSRNPNKLIGIISVNHIMRLLSTDVFSHNR